MSVKLLSLLMILITVFLSSCGCIICKSTLHTLPDSISSRAYRIVDDRNELEVHTHNNVLYLGLTANSHSVPISILEYRTLHTGWKNIPNLDTSNTNAHKIYFPLTKELIEMWNKKQKVKLLYSHYDSKLQTDELIKNEGVKIATGYYDSAFAEAVVKHHANAGIGKRLLAPISFSCDIADAVSLIPCTIIASAATLPIGIIYVTIDTFSQNNRKEEHNDTL